MPDYGDLASVARILRDELEETGADFRTVDRMRITQLVREHSGNLNTRMKPVMAGQLDHALLTLGVRCRPTLEETTTGDRIRLFKAGSAVAELFDAVDQHPSVYSDRELSSILSKLRTRRRKRKNRTAA